VPRRRLSYRAADGARLRAGFAAIRSELEVPTDFPVDVLAEAEDAARSPRLPSADLRDVPFLTVDPPGSMDLDQALHLERRDGGHGGYRLRYAIADVAAFVRPGGRLDAEAHRRGETLYLPDGRAPLHPPRLSEGAASLLPGEDRPAVVWTLSFDADGDSSGVEVTRALVRSRDRFDYAGIQQALDGGSDDERLVLLRELGTLREERQADRGGIDLQVPEQEVVEGGAGYDLRYRAPLPVEGWNAQLSLAAGMAGAELMLYGEVGILRTLPRAPVEQVHRLRRVAHALGVDWPDDLSYAQMIRGLDPRQPQHAAMLEECTSLLRGAGYTPFDGGVPEQATHAAVAAEYAHVTAPLRRLVDRYAGEVCLSLCGDVPVPDWVQAALPALPKEMAASDERSSRVEHACVDLVEAALLERRVGETFDGVLVDVEAERKRGTVQLRDPAVRARVGGEALPLGDAVRVTLTEAAVSARLVRFSLA